MFRTDFYRYKKQRNKYSEFIKIYIWWTWLNDLWFKWCKKIHEIDYDNYDSELKDSIYLHSNSGIKGLNKQLINLYDEEIIISKNTIGINIK